MRVSLIDYTGHGRPDAADYAAAVLLFTKNTRLQMSPGLFETIKAWPEHKKLAELGYMANTIPSSWEFVHFTFLIEDVTRAFTHQFVRTRTASYAQQTMRVLNVGGWTYGTGPSIPAGSMRRVTYDSAMKKVAEAYDQLVAEGANIEDARGILPTNIHTNIVMSCSLRTLCELVRKRSSPRTQGEYREVLEEMKRVAAEALPFTHMFFNRDFDSASKDLDAEIAEIPDQDKKIRMMKLVDQLRAG
jgi:flavin-dependent thymidylate synthase